MSVRCRYSTYKFAQIWVNYRELALANYVIKAPVTVVTGAKAKTHAVDNSQLFCTRLVPSTEY